MLEFKHLVLLLSLVLIFAFKSHPQITPVKLINQPLKPETEGDYPLEKYGRQKMAESSLLLLENKDHLIPFLRLDTLHIAVLSVGAVSNTPFQKMTGNYTKVDCFHLSDDFTGTDLKTMVDKLSSYNLIITAIHSQLWKVDSSLVKRDNLKRDPALSANEEIQNLDNLLKKISLIKNQVVVFFSEPDFVSRLGNIGNPEGLLIANQNDMVYQELAAQLLFGGVSATGKLLVPIGNQYHSGDGLTTIQPIRLKYTLPEEVGISSGKLNWRIDSLVNSALVMKAFPGCNVLVAVNGKVIFQKAYGFHTYEQRVPSSPDDIYDLASVTKVAGALPAIMKLNEEGKYLLDEPFSRYWTDWKRRIFHPSNKNDLTVRELLAHQAGLVPYQPFWKASMSNKMLSHKWYGADKSDRYNLEVAPGLYIDSKFKKKVYKSIRKSPVKTRGKYVYSDLSFIIAPEVITKLSGIEFTEFLNRNFYRPLGASTMTYNPSRKFSADQIVPTEYDTLFRKRLVHGSVHDEASAILGGISGNAGLFASANDLAKIVQMYVQFGTYGGREYLKKSTIEEFNRVQFPQNNNRRGLGFDKPLINNYKFDKDKAYPCPGATPESFGHSGFTGTFFWADPTNGLIYVFLSNRVYPTRENNKITELNVRTEILQVLYDELNEIRKNENEK